MIHCWILVPFQCGCSTGALQTITFEYYHVQIISSTYLFLNLRMLFHIFEIEKRKRFELVETAQVKYMELLLEVDK